MGDLLIVGGEAIAMMTALQLADTGLDVTMVERGESAREAS
ncbi:NAD-binding protein [Halomonas alkalisoli]